MIKLTVLSIVVLIFTVISFTSSWWIVDFLHHCKDDVHLVVYLRYGVCGVDKTGGISRNNCIRWNEHHEWEEIDRDAHTNTLHAARGIFPVANVLFLFSLCASVLQMAVCIAYFKFRRYARLEQYLTVVFSSIYTVTSFSVGMMGGKTDVTLDSTWSRFTECRDGYSYPFTAYYAIAIACVASGIILILVIMPGNFYCFHLVDYEIDLEEFPSLSSAKVLHDSCQPQTSPTSCNPIAYVITNDLSKTIHCDTDVTISQSISCNSVITNTSTCATEGTGLNHSSISLHSANSSSRGGTPSSFSLGED